MKDADGLRIPSSNRPAHCPFPTILRRSGWRFAGGTLNGAHPVHRGDRACFMSIKAGSGGTTAPTRLIDHWLSLTSRRRAHRVRRRFETGCWKPRMSLARMPLAGWPGHTRPPLGHYRTGPHASRFPRPDLHQEQARVKIQAPSYMTRSVAVRLSDGPVWSLADIPDAAVLSQKGWCFGKQC